MRHIGEKMILLLCIAVFGIAAVKLIDIGKEYYDGQKEYKGSSYVSRWNL